MVKLIVNYYVMTREEAKLKIDVILRLVNLHIFPERWRSGQALFNMCYVNFLEQTSKLRGTDVDCYNDDSKQELFINTLLERFKSNDD